MSNFIGGFSCGECGIFMPYTVEVSCDKCRYLKTVLLNDFMNRGSRVVYKFEYQCENRVWNHFMLSIHKHEVLHAYKGCRLSAPDTVMALFEVKKTEEWPKILGYLDEKCGELRKANYPDNRSE